MYRYISASSLLRTSSLLCRRQPKMASSACKQVVLASEHMFCGTRICPLCRGRMTMELFFDTRTVCSLLRDYGAVQHLHSQKCCGGRFFEHDASASRQEYRRGHLISGT